MFVLTCRQRKKFNKFLHAKEPSTTEVRLTCVAHCGSVISKVYKSWVSIGASSLRATMSRMDSPFGPRGGMACTCSADTVEFRDKVGGPKIAMTNKYDQMN